MSERGKQLAGTAARQIGELMDILSTGGEPALRLPCPGRQKLGDGTVAALAQHTIENYHRIAGFIRHDSTIADRAVHGHDTRHSAESIGLPALLARLLAARGAVGEFADIGDDQLDAVPTAGALRFADGQRTLEQVIAAALNHQEHQVDALRAAVTQS